MQDAGSLPGVFDELEAAVASLVAWARRMPSAGWKKRAGSDTAAEVLQALVTELAELGHAVEVGARSRPDRWRSPAPAPYPGALADRLAVVGRDLVDALRAAPPDHQAWYADEQAPAHALARAALDAVSKAATAAR